MNWSERVFWLALGLALGTFLTAWSAVHHGYVSW
jgi:uncharacterized protein HemY